MTFEKYEQQRTNRKEAEEPKRMIFAKSKLKELNIKTTQINDSLIEFEFKGSIVKFFPFTGWASGKTIKDGRGIKNLIKQLSNG